VYAPTAEAEEMIHDEFYETLQETMNNIPKGDVVLVMGDFNAKIGAVEGDQFIGRYGLGSRNESGYMLHELCAVNDLIVANSLFKQPSRRLYLLTTPDGKHRNQIDFIIIKSRSKSESIPSKTRPIKTGPAANCGTDQELLLADLKLRLKRVQTDRMPKSYDF